MSQFLLVAAVALTVGAIVFGVSVLATGDDRGLHPAEPDGRGVPLPADRPLTEADLGEVQFDTAVRGYRMAQVDAALRRAAYDVGYKDELIKVLQAEIDALRAGRHSDAEVLRRAREDAAAPPDGEQAPAAAPPPAGRRGVPMSDDGPAEGAGAPVIQDGATGAPPGTHDGAARGESPGGVDPGAAGGGSLDLGDGAARGGPPGLGDGATRGGPPGVGDGAAKGGWPVAEGGADETTMSGQR